VTRTALTNPSALKAVLGKYGFSFKKQLGQNFLVDEIILEDIRNAAEISPRDGVLEVGPGAGVVTQMLAQKAQVVVAVEKDRALKPILEDTLGAFENVEVIFEDVLRLDFSHLWRTAFADCERVHIVANLPYYITTPILFHVLESGVNWTNIVVMVQKEVAERLVAPPGGKDYGALTLTVGYYASVEKVTVVPPTSFLPPPNVHSTVVRLSRYNIPPVDVPHPDVLFRIIRAAFSMRRKTLLNTLSGALGIPKSDCQTWIDSAGIDSIRRGETLSLREFAQLARLGTDIVKTTVQEDESI